MTQQATRNKIRRYYKNIINVGYANLANLFNYDEADYYNHGIYGWNWDAYELDWNTCIITGDKNTLGEDINHEYTQIINKNKHLVKHLSTNKKKQNFISTSSYFKHF